MNDEFLEDIYKYPGIESLTKLKLLSSKYLNNNIKYIQVTGTNGKGSVSRMIHAILWQTSNIKVGLFTSPHITVINERIIINDTMISNHDLIRIKNLINHDIEHYQLGFFAILTLIALIYFQEQKVKWAVIEVGIGGRYDTTSVIDATYAVITSIGKDHQEILGNTLKQILYQKIGIVKPSTKILFVSGNLNSNLKHEIRKQGYQPCYSPKLINQSYYEENKSLALTVIQNAFPNIALVSANRIIKNLKIKFRFEKYKIDNKIVYFDAAHNREGINALIKTLKSNNIVPDEIIFSCLKNKYPNQLLTLLKKISNNITVCQNSHVQSINAMQFNYESMIKNSKNKIILITGSCYFLADVYNYLCRIDVLNKY
ncbi:Mur ligase family protein [Spiroplasma sp. AdecLV25b]|uniref:bifunctional folylpolyglutamate synthase/dihydrofolate synthase n=1 Tax=Spiroplasma sp. AdecLV25b TaxID=3027162 RepID=UPI0027DFECC8|nr:Mur ligase family protein [Spiroplasma sp. AdecLV25b]